MSLTVLRFPSGRGTDSNTTRDGCGCWRSQMRGESEEGEHFGDEEGGDVHELAFFDVEHVEGEGAELLLSGLAEIVRCCWLPVGSGGDESELVAALGGRTTP